MSTDMQFDQQLTSLGLSASMLGGAERLALPPGAHAALQASPVAESRLQAHSAVLDGLGFSVEVDRTVTDLHVISRGGHPYAVRTSADDVTPGDSTGLAHVTLRDAGGFVIEQAGVPLVFGRRAGDALEVYPLFAWPAPPIEEWIVNTRDTWMQQQAHAGQGADIWTRTALGGLLARLMEPEPADVASLIAEGRFAALVSDAELAPRRWVRSLEPSATAALEQLAVRRAEALADDLTDLYDTLSADMDEASTTWVRLCHRRDDLECVRVLLREAGVGDRLDDALAEADRAGRAIRINLTADLSAADERLRRAALADPAAWWGSTAFEPHYF